MVLLDPPGQRADVALQAGRPRFPARLFPPQKRRLEGRTARIRSPPGAPRSWRRCRPTTSWICSTTCRPRREGDAVGGRDRRLPLAARQRTRGLCRRIRAQRLPGRANWYRSRTSGAFEVGIAGVFRPHDRRAVDLHLRQERLGRLSAARFARKNAERGLHAHGRRAICSTAPAIGCSRSSPKRSAAC